MLKIQKDIPIKDTINYLAKFPKFSLIEKFTPKFYKTSNEAAIEIAKVIKQGIQNKQKQGKLFILGLATGSSPTQTYKQLINLHKDKGLSFHNVVVFQLDQFYPINSKDPQSYQYFLRKNFLEHIDIRQENIYLLNGDIPKGLVSSYCQEYQKKIQSYGSIDLQLLGIGRSGHIGFNQPPSSQNSRTRVVYLHRLTRKDAGRSFGGIEYTPKCALTMGISTIKKAKNIIIMAWSQTKAQIVLKSIQGQITSQNPVSFLHNHPSTIFYFDPSAGQLLSRFTIPWTIKGDSQDPHIPRTKYWIMKSVIWLSQKTKKPILRLTNDDYEDNGLSPLVIDCANGKVQDLNLFVYKLIHQKITGWPLGDRPKQSSTNTSFIQKKSLHKQNILIFSPHPDDDVISMGGTLRRLVRQGHNVSVAYMTSGSNAVHDHDAKKYLYFLQQFSKEHIWSINNPSVIDFFEKYQSNIHDGFNHFNDKTKTQRKDTKQIIQVKTLIRSSQAKIAVQSLGVSTQNTYCLKLPFYGNNQQKQQISQKDYQIIRDLFKVTQPNFIYAAGDLTDPHGTHRKCLEIILKVIDEEYQKAKQNQGYKCLVPPPERVYLYRGAWQQWDIQLSKHLVVMSPEQMQQKIDSILKHQSQKDTPMFPGDDSRQFWVRVKERNRETASKLNRLGFSDYQAFECFVDLNDLRSHDQI